MKSLGSFKQGESDLGSCLWMLQQTDAYKTLALLEWDAECKNKADLIKNGFKSVKKFKVPEWIKFKCGEEAFVDKFDVKN